MSTSNLSASINSRRNLNAKNARGRKSALKFDGSVSSPNRLLDIDGDGDPTELMFDHLQQQINFADTKAQLILGTNALLGTTVATLDKGMALTVFNSHLDSLERVAMACTLLLFVALAISVYFALVVTRPSLRSSKTHHLLFFGSIAQKEEQKFVSDFLNLSESAMQKELAAEIHAMAGIAHTKFAGMRWSMNFLMLGLLCWVAAQLLQAIS